MVIDSAAPADRQACPTLHDLITRLVDGAAYIGIAALIGQALLVVADVTMRVAWSAAVYGAIDIYQLLTIIVIASFIPFAVHGRRNVQLRMFDGLRWSLPKRFADRFADLCTLLFLSAVAWQTARYASHVANEVTPILELPVAPIWWIGCTLVGISVPAQVLVCLQAFADDRTQREDDPTKGSE